MKKTVAFILAIVLMFSLFACGNSDEKDYMDTLAIQQVDPKWNDYVPTGFSSGMGPSACGIFAMVNSIRYLTGTLVDPTEIAEVFVAADAFTEDGGTWRWKAFIEDGPAEKILKEKNIPVEFAKYWCDCSDFTQLDEYLEQGCACEFHVPGHFMTCVAKDNETGKYLVLDSAIVNPKRNTSLGGTWFDASQLSQGGIHPMTGFCAYRPLEDVPEHELPPTDNSEVWSYCNLVVDSTGQTGKANFVGTKARANAAKVGDTVKLHVKPGWGYMCAGLSVGGSYIDMINDGKEATYEFEQPETVADVIVYFTPKG